MAAHCGRRRAAVQQPIDAGGTDQPDFSEPEGIEMPANYRQAANLVRYAKPACGFGDAIWRAGIVCFGGHAGLLDAVALPEHLIARKELLLH